MHGQEVSMQMVGHWVPGYERHGIQCEPLMAGLGFGRADLKDRSRRISWSDFIEFMERLATAAGGYQALAMLVGSVYQANPWMQLLAGCVLSPQRLYVLSQERIGRKLYSNVGMRVELLPGGLVRIENRIPDEDRPSLAFHYATLGCLRVVPRLLGLADAKVEADITPRCSVFLVDPPPSRTLGSQAVERIREFMTAMRPADEEVQDSDIILDESDVVHSVAPLGQQMACQTDPNTLGQLFADFLHQRFCSRHVALVLKRDGMWQQDWISQRHGPAVEHRLNRSLLVDGQEVGRIDVDLPAAAVGERVPLFEAVIPWLALGAANVQRALSQNGAPPSPNAPRLQRAEELTARWNLTPREGQVLKMLLAGAANKEIAQGLGGSVKTVEYHVRNVLRKAGVDNRSALMARLLSEDHPPE